MKSAAGGGGASVSDHQNIRRNQLSPEPAGRAELLQNLQHADSWQPVGTEPQELNRTELDPRNQTTGTGLNQTGPDRTPGKVFILPPLQKPSMMLHLLLLLCFPPAVVSLFCYTCVFPAVSPLDCIRFPLKCPPGQLCLSSRAVGQKGDLRVVLYEKSCVLPALCGVTGEKYALGLNFTFINECCNTHLCNAAGRPAGPPLWTALLALLPLLALGSAR